MFPTVDRRFGLIFSLSLAAHAAALLGLPGLNSTPLQAAPAALADTASASRLSVRLLVPASSAPAPSTNTVNSAPPMPLAPVARRVLSSPRAVPSPAPQTAVSVQTASSAPSQPTVSGPLSSELAVTPPASVLAVAPQAAPPVQSSQSAAPAPSSEAMLDAYRRQLNALVAAPRDYPRLAALRGWEGEVRLRLRIARKGNLLAVQLDRSSGFEVLDQHALALLGQYADFPPLPERWEGSDLQVVIPIHYKLRKTT